MDTRRRDGSRSAENWVRLVDLVEPYKIFTLKSLSKIEEENVTIMDINGIPREEILFFMQFGVIPVKKDGKIGIIISSAHKRVPEQLIKNYLGFVYVLSPDDCISLSISTFSNKSTRLMFGKDVKSIDAVKEILSKMETLKASDLTMSWRKDFASLSYTISGHNAVEHEDSITLEIAEKLRISIINMAYESQAEKIIDGKFSIHINGDLKEYRLSVIETVAGYSLVIRSYQKFDSDITLSDLGYTKKPLLIIENILKNTYGIFLVTGPTGSGKTTTIYTIINNLFRDFNLKIKTAEDPVEKELYGIDQCQINKKGEDKHQVTYMNLLSSFMRQRPDLMVIGEIRDKDVATATVEAALTGHNVISTLHTNNVKSTITRLTSHLGVTIDRIEDSFSGILSQRLVDKLCDCKIKKGAGFEENPDGCEKCANQIRKGFYGQIPAVEVASMGKFEENYIETNFLDYYSYADSANDLYKEGFIDLKTKKILEII